MGSATPKNNTRSFETASRRRNLPSADIEVLKGSELPERFNDLRDLRLQRRSDAVVGLLQNGLSPSAAAQATGQAATSPKSPTKPAASTPAKPKISYKSGVPVMRLEVQDVVEKAAQDVGIGSMGIQSTQEGKVGDGFHDLRSNHYNRPGKPGTAVDISVIDGRPVNTYEKDPYVRQKVDALQKALDQYGVHENFGPSRLTRDGKPVPQITQKQKELARQHRTHVHIDPPRREGNQ